MLLVTTPGMEQEFFRTCKKNHLHSKWLPILKTLLTIPIQKSDAFVRLSYVGNLKANQNAPMLWKAIAELSKNEVFKSSFRLCFTGSVHPEIIKSIEDSGIKQNSGIKLICGT